MPTQDVLDLYNHCTLQSVLSLVDQTELAVFDFDGTVAFTEEHQMKAFAGIVERYTGVKLDYKEVAKEMIGKTEGEILGILMDRHGMVVKVSDEDRARFAEEYPGMRPEVAHLVEERGEIYAQSVIDSGIQPNEFVLQICRRVMKTPGKKKAIIWSNGRSKIIERLLKHWGIRDLFGDLHASDTMRRDLPLTERKLAFIADMPKLYGVDAKDIVVFEDSTGTIAKVRDMGKEAVYVSHALNPDVTKVQCTRPGRGPKMAFSCSSLADACGSVKGGPVG